MRTLYLIIVIYLGLCVSACSTTPKTPATKNTQTALNNQQSEIITPTTKDPFTIAMYRKGEKPHNPYKILGTETISKFNDSGIKRQVASINDAMRNLAASIGGDAVIDLAYDDKSVTGTVISYQKTQKNTA